ncbi:MAG TPA: type II toxin-antitoxin system PemK/MazF family toxin [Candidatus Limnocylindrales bacterium]|nr:type II toxin-antitoxin system PemK/MazF family toxin [Candidatus Limnocylindrales bacterium]
MVGIGRTPARGGPTRGDIYIVAFPEAGGAVILGPHPALIVSTDRMNRAGGTLLACPMTSQMQHDPEVYLPPYLVPADARSTGLSRDGYVKVDQVHTLSAAALGSFMGRANPEVMTAVDDALRFVLDL